MADDRRLRSGDSLRGIIDSMPTDRQLCESYDCTKVICMFNCPAGTTRAQMMEKNSDIGMLIVRLCRMLQGHKRPVLIMGGSALLWKFPDGWDTFAAHLVLMCRTNGVLCIDGVQRLSQIRRAPDGWHSAKADIDMDKSMDMVYDAINVAYSVIPYGTYATAQAVLLQDNAEIIAPPTQVGASVSGASSSVCSSTRPTQVGSDYSVPTSGPPSRRPPAPPIPHAPPTQVGARRGQCREEEAVQTDWRRYTSVGLGDLESRLFQRLARGGRVSG